MSNEGIQQAADAFREKIQLAQTGSNRSQDILEAIREFLANLSGIIPNSQAVPPAAQQEIIRSFEEIKERLETNNSQ